VKAAITVSLIAWICAKIDFSVLARHLHDGGAVYLVLGTLLLALNDTVVATRWWLLLRRLNVEAVSLGYIVAGTYAGVFIGQAAPGPIGADAVRGWLCHRRGVPLRTVVMSLFTDRSLALLGYVAVALMAGYWQIEAVGLSVGRELAVLGIVAAAAAVIVLWLLPALAGAVAKRWPRFHAVQDLLAVLRVTALSAAGRARRRYR